MIDFLGIVTSIQERSVRSEQEIKCALKEIQRIYDMQAKADEQLNCREEELNRREQAWEEEKTKRQEEVTALEQRRASIDAEIAKSEEEKESLSFEIAALQKQFDELKNEIEKEREVFQKEKDALAEREAAVNQRETMLNIQEEMKKGQKASINEMLVIQTQLKQVQLYLKSAMQNFVQTGNLVEGSAITPGLRELVDLYRRMRASSNKEVIYYADLVERVLIQYFGTEKFTPACGDSVDYKWMECSDAANRGNIVEECISCGWKKGDTLLERAIVDVKEK